jgi:very-short-patch-repair endonuclease
MSSAHGKLRRQVQLTAYAHRMRMAPSEPERVLWQAIRGSHLGVRFLRQVVLHGFIVDFFAPAARLVVEVDGAQHAFRRNADKRRDRALGSTGLRVVRVPAALVTQNLPAALQLIAGALQPVVGRESPTASHFSNSPALDEPANP